MNATGRPQFAFEKPGPVLKWTLIAYFAVWLVFALGMNWGGVSSHPLESVTANTEAIAAGQVWRLFTAAWVPQTNPVIGMLITLALLYMFGAQMEKEWGGKRFAYFLLSSGALAYAAQFLVFLVLPGYLAERLRMTAPFGATPVIEALIIAWACTFPDRTIYFFLVVPMKAKNFIYITLGYNVLSMIALEPPTSGHIALFFGMAAGWLLGGGTPSPLRRYYLKYKLSQLEREAVAERRAKKKRAQRSGLQVLPGGKDDKRPPKDMLN